MLHCNINGALQKRKAHNGSVSTFLGLVDDLLAFGLCKVLDLPKFSG
jgi:hypothetical protein